VMPRLGGMIAVVETLAEQSSIGSDRRAKSAAQNAKGLPTVQERAVAFKNRRFLTAPMINESGKC